MSLVLTRYFDKTHFIAGANTISDGRVVVGTLLSDTVDGSLYICTSVGPIVFTKLTGGTGAPSSSAYVIIGVDGTLSGYRTLTAGTGITITDGGATGPVTIASSAAAASQAMGRTFALMGA